MAKGKDERSLDFTQPARAAKPAAAAAPRKAKPTPAGDEPSTPRRWGLLLVIVIAAVVAVVWSTRDQAPTQGPGARKGAKSAAVAEPEAQVAPKAAQPYPPPTKLQIPEKAPAKGLDVSAMPPEFLKAVQAYNTKAGFKALALALDADGKFGYGSVSGAAAQKTANDDALVECAKFKLQSGATSDCKLFAIGDKVVW